MEKKDFFDLFHFQPRFLTAYSNVYVIVQIGI